MSDSRPVIMQCENCDKDMREGDEMQATVRGTASGEVDGFSEDVGIGIDAICQQCADVGNTRPDAARVMLRALQDVQYWINHDPDLLLEAMESMKACVQTAIKTAKEGGITL